MSKKIKVGDRFFLPQEKGWKRRECVHLPDNPSPDFECERMVVKVFAIPSEKVTEQIFPVEHEWFIQRGLAAQ